MSPRFSDPALDERFRRDGFVVVDLLDAAEIAALRRVHADHASSYAPGFSATFLLPDPKLRRRVHAQVAAVLEPHVAALLPGDALLFSGFIVKSANEPAGQLDLHQDMTFVDEPAHASLNIWCPLVDTGPDNGWLGVVPGSQHLNAHPRPPGAHAYRDHHPRIERDHLVHLPVTAGQAVFMDNRTLHGSPPNLTGDARPVAAGVIAPAGAALRYCHQDWGQPGTYELFAIDRDFYFDHRIGTRPQGYPLVESGTIRVDPFTLPSDTL